MLEIRTNKAYDSERHCWAAEIEYRQDGVLSHKISKIAPSELEAAEAARSEFNAVNRKLLSQMWES
jgi:hypothetical protein